MNFLFKLAAKIKIMKIKKLLKISGALMVMALFLSSCNSSIQVSKKRHSNGYYVNIGGGNFESQARPVQNLALSNGAEKTETNKVDELLKAENTQEVVSTNNTTKVSNTELQTVKKETIVNHVTSSKKVSGKKSNKISNIKKAIKIKKALKNNNADNTSDVALLLLVILAIILPPVAVFLVKGLKIQFWLSLILTLLFWLPGVIYALLIVLGAL